MDTFQVYFQGRGLLMKKEQKGFTLVEIMTAVAIIGLIASLSLPALLRSRMNANEAAAQATLRTLHDALTSYNFTRTPPSYPSDLAALAALNPPYITQQLANNISSGGRISSGGSGFKGYLFRYAPQTSGTITYNYTLFAAPADENRTGSRYFSMDGTGQLREVSQSETTGEAGSVSPALD